MDGKLMKENIKMAGINEAFIDTCIKKAKVKRYKDVLLMTLDNNGEVFVQEKNADEYYNFQMKFDGSEKW